MLVCLCVEKHLDRLTSRTHAHIAQSSNLRRTQLTFPGSWGHSFKSIFNSKWVWGTLKFGFRGVMLCDRHDTTRHDTDPEY